MHRKDQPAPLGIALISLVMFLLCSSPLRAQTSYGAIAGTVTDTTGAVVPGATVNVTNTGTNETKTAQTSASGEYRFVNLPPANYKVDVEAQSFKHFVQDSVQVQVDSTIQLDVALQTGVSTEVVEVTAAVPLQQTESGTVGSVVEGKVVQEMPLNGRNAMNLVALVPGVVPESSTAGAPSDNAGIHTLVTGWGNYQIGGGIANTSAIFLDGAPNNMLGNNSPALILTQDAVQEFKVATNVVSAEFGRFGGGVIEMASKSGTNAFHGTVYEYFRNTVLNANDFLTNYAGLPRAAFHQNQYGAALGGPIKKDKAFGFFSWENYTLRKAISGNTNVPTAAMRAGIFNKPIVDPSTKHCPIEANTPTVGQYTIPQSCLDPTSVVMLGYFALPNSSNPQYNYVVSPVIGDDTTQYNARVDYDFSSKQRIFGRYTYWPLNDIGQNEFEGKGLPFPTDYGSTHNRTHAIVLGDTYTINTNTIADVRLSWIRDHFFNYGSAIGSKHLPAFGPAYAALASQVSFSSIPTLLFGGPDNLFLQLPVGANQIDTQEDFALSAGVTKIVGNHSLKFGGDVSLRNHSGIGNSPNYAGWSIYTPAFTGDEFASFLLGEFNNDKIQTIITTFTYDWAEALYATDTWRVNQNLTLNMGLRWEVPGGLAEKKNRATVLLPDTVDPVTGYKGSLGLVDSPLYHSRAFSPVRYDLFGPRFSFAERLSNTLVARGGYGLSYLPPDMPTGVMAFNGPVAAANTNSVNGFPTPQYFQANPWPNGILQPPGRTVQYPAQLYLGNTLTSPVPTNKYPYMQQWNLTLSKQWQGDWLTEVTYAGSKGTQLPRNGASQSQNYSIVGLDELPPQYYSMGLPALTATAPCAALGGQMVQVGQCLRPYPQYQDYQNTDSYGGGTNYNALYVVAAKRFHSGGVLNANYTWSRMMGDTDQPGAGAGGFMQDYYNHRADYSISGYDVAHRAVINYVLNLPFGRGQRWAGDSGRAVNAVAGGWSVNGITTFQSGFPLAFSYNSSSPLFQNWGAGTARPDILPGCKLSTSGGVRQKFINNNWFNAACVVPPGASSPTGTGNPLQFGDAPRNSGQVRGQFLYNSDFALSKSTPVKEGVNVLFRAEFFDLFNHPYFPANTVGTELAGSNYDGINSNGPSVPSRLVQLSLRVSF